MVQDLVQNNNTGNITFSNFRFYSNNEKLVLNFENSRYSPIDINIVDLTGNPVITDNTDFSIKKSAQRAKEMREAHF